jgi:hypothetical protein
MKFNIPKRGDKRVIKHFCLLPRTVNNVRYWLKYINISQTYEICYDLIYDYVIFDSVPVCYDGWVDKEVIENETV